MSTVDLPVCPICKVHESPVRRVERKEGRLSIQYECRSCGSVLVWLGDELWLNGNHWSYHKIGLPDQVHLLHQSFTSAELQQMAGIDLPGPATQPERSPPSAPIRVEILQDKAPPLRRSPDRKPEEPVAIILEPTSQEPSAKTTIQQPAFAPSPPTWAEPPLPSTPQPTRERLRSRGSPLLMIAVGITMLCLICTAAILIADSLF
ncbi:MAG: hypothetical protein ACUVWZ_11525 [Anaerolineae bacterium]